MARYVMHLVHKIGDGRRHLQAKGRTIRIVAGDAYLAISDTGLSA